MKRTILLALLLACGTAQASEWVSVGAVLLKTGKKVEDFVDVSSIRVARNIRRAWFKKVFPPHTRRGSGGDSGKWVSYTEHREAFNCDEETTTSEALTVYYYDGTNFPLPPEYYPQPWEPVAPDTITHNKMQFICAWKPK